MTATFTSSAPTRIIDARGMACPSALMVLIGAIRHARVGDVVEVISCDHISRTGIRAWVAEAGHELIGVRAGDGCATFVVRKARA